MGLWLRLSAFHSNCFLVSPGSCSIIFLWRKKKNTTQHKKLGRLSKVRYVTHLAQYPAPPGDFYIVSYWVQGELRRRAYKTTKNWIQFSPLSVSTTSVIEGYTATGLIPTDDAPVREASLSTKATWELLA